MKANIFLLFILLSSQFINAQDINKVVFDEMAEENILLGYFNREALNGDDFNFWFDAEYKSYSVDEVTLENIQDELISSLDIKLVMGTWCHDSQREVPRFYKILDLLNFENKNLSMIGVNRMKLADETEVNELNIELVPTIIFYIEGEEIGRIIESPIESLEKDMIRILTFD
jgi:thiol-disulfide isomerase/thioredoxin